MTKYENDKQLIPTFSPDEIYQYSDSVLKHLPEKLFKKIKKSCYIAINLSTIIEQQKKGGHLTAQRQQT